jgi:hypothetical protein
MPRVRGATAAAAAALAAILAAGAAGKPAGRPVTLAYATGPITALAQDDGRIAWASVKNCIATVRIRTLATRRQSGVGSADTNNCASATELGGLGEMQLELAGDRALWSYGEVGNIVYTWLKTGSLSGAKNQRLPFAPLAHDQSPYETGDHFTGMAGDGSTLVFAYATIGVTGSEDCDIDGTCTVILSGGGARRVVGTAADAVAGVPAPFAIAAGGKRIAIIQAAPVGTVPGPKPSSAIQVRNAVTGALVTSFTPMGTARAIALSRTSVAVLVSGAGGTRIERHAVPGGGLLASTAVPATTARELSTNGTVVVFRVGRSIRTVPVGAGGASVVATAAAAPVGLSVEGKRVIWAENRTTGGVLKGRIQSVTL